MHDGDKQHVSANTHDDEIESTSERFRLHCDETRVKLVKSICMQAVHIEARHIAML